MFQLKSRVSPLTYSDQPREVINQRIQEFQEKEGVVFSSVKELFETLLLRAMQSNPGEPEIVEKEVLPENAVIITEDMIENLKAIDLEQFDKNDLKHVVWHAINKAATENEPKTIEIEKEVVKEIERPLKENEVRFSFEEREMIIMNQIQENRKRKFNRPELENLSSLAKKMAFNSNSVLDLGGEFYTGISALTKI